MKVHVLDRKVMWGDLDPLGIVFYPRYYEWIDACAHLFFESLGLPMGELFQKRGIIFGLVETGCRYHSPGRYHDSIRIRTSLAELGPRTMLLRYRVSRTPQEELLVEGLERRICLDATDPGRLRATEIPPDILEILRPALEAAHTGERSHEVR